MDELTNDVYAACLALFPIVLFAKFATHRRHRGLPAKRWRVLHVTCVLAAVVGLLASLFVLAFSGPTSWDAVVRWMVVAVAALSFIILAVDVLLASAWKERADDGRTDAWRTAPLFTSTQDEQQEEHTQHDAL